MGTTTVSNPQTPQKARKLYLIELERIANGWVMDVMPPQGNSRKSHGATLAACLTDAQTHITENILEEPETG